MLEIDGVIDAYFEDEIQIPVRAPGKLDAALVEEILNEREIAFTRIAKAAG